MKCVKCQGTGNDFLIMDLIKYPLDETIDRAAISKVLCDRTTGYGADGILFVEASASAHAKMRIFNADGSEALMCGNGLRCFARYVMDQRHVDDIYVETLMATYHVTCDIYFDQHLNGYKILLNNVMYYGETDFTKAYAKALDSEYTFEYLTVSNPHAVVMMPEIPNDDILKHYGVFANTEKAYFKDGVNVNFVTVIDENALYVRTYERGVGITKSCGTGMTSSVTAYARRQGKLNEWIDIYNDGGKIKCKVVDCGDHYEVEFVGNASYEYTLEGSIDQLLNIEIEKVIDYKEQKQFDTFFEATRQALKKAL